MIVELCDVEDFIETASPRELSRIIQYAEEHGGVPGNKQPFKNQKEGTFVQSEKRELLEKAFNKYTLEELEHRLGSKWDLI